jgi:hypothetical protein
MKRRDRIEIAGDWHGRDRFLESLRRACGYRSIGAMLQHAAHEIARCKTPAEFYRALSGFDQIGTRKRKPRK